MLIRTALKVAFFKGLIIGGMAVCIAGCMRIRRRGS